MNWSLFLDDERFPPMSVPDDWVIARTVHDAQVLIDGMGLPWRMSLDHDLGPYIPNGYYFLKWLVNEDLDGNLDINMIRDFYVHSQNPVGAENINKLFSNYKSQKGVTK